MGVGATEFHRVASTSQFNYDASHSELIPRKSLIYRRAGNDVCNKKTLIYMEELLTIYLVLIAVKGLMKEYRKNWGKYSKRQ